MDTISFRLKGNFKITGIANFIPEFSNRSFSELSDKERIRSKDLRTRYLRKFIPHPLVEEEVYQRLNPSEYKDQRYDGTNMSICCSSNLDIGILDNKMNGGSKESKYIPGKFEAVKYSYHLPLDVAIKSSFERQQLFIKSMNK